MSERFFNICTDCRRYGDDYHYNDVGEWVCQCGECPFNDEPEVKLNDTQQ